MKPVPFRQRLVVQLAVGMISVALLSLFLTFGLQFVTVALSGLQPPDVEGTVERLLAENPDDEALLALTRFPFELRRVLITSSLLGVALSGGLWVYLALRFARRIADPIERVTDAAAKITGGDLSARVLAPPKRTSGETAGLLAHFNEMAGALERYERERTEMVAAIAHELRTPLAVMLARLELMDEGLVAPDEKELKGLTHQAKLLTRLVGDLRTLSLADAERLSLHKQPFRLDDLVRRVVGAFEERAKEQGVTLTRDLEPAQLTADPDRLEQVLINLLANALEHTPAGGRVTVTLRSEGQVCLSVADTGPGFGGEPGRLFARFYKGEGSSGSGLGLALVKTLVELHGGTVAAENLPGGGAAFTVTLEAGRVPTVTAKP